MRFLPETAVPDTAAEVSTLTVLQDWTNLGARYHLLLVYLLNTGASPVSFIVETSEDGVHPDVNTTTIVVPAGEQGSLEIGPYLLRRYWRLSAHSESPTFPTVNVTFGIRGNSRSG